MYFFLDLLGWNVFERFVIEVNISRSKINIYNEENNIVVLFVVEKDYLFIGKFIEYFVFFIFR